MPYSLSKDEQKRFESEGWIGPFPLLPADEARALARELQRAYDQTKGFYYPDRETLTSFYAEGGSHYNDTPWFQSLHALSPRLLEVGAASEIVDRVGALLGEDVMLWGTICFFQPPNGKLHWHSDNEFHHVRGVSAWMGAANTTPNNALKIIPGSHQFSKRPEDFLSTGAETMLSMQDDARALKIAKAMKPDVEIVRPAVSDGEFILFNGALWHGSDNPSEDLRYAMGLRYSPPDQKVRIPMTPWEPTIWDPAQPPTVMVKGEDRFGLNRRL